MIFRNLLGTLKNVFRLGDGLDTHKVIEFNNGDDNPPKLRYNYETEKFQFTENGVDWADIADTFDTVADRGATTDQAVTTGGLMVIPSSASQTVFSTQSLQSTAPLGSELIINGSFDSDLGGWTIGGAGTGWSWDSEGKAIHNAGNGDTLHQNIEVTDGTTYHVEITISGRTAGYIFLDIGGVYIYKDGGTKSLSSNATYKRSLVASGTSSQAVTITPSSSFDGKIDNIVVKAIVGDSQPNAVFIDDSGSNAAQIRGDYGLANIFIGVSGKRNTTGSSNSAMGINSLYINTTGGSNLAMGRGALRYNTIGGNNSAIGRNALYSNTMGFHNSAMGRDALRYNTTGGNNSAIGGSSLYNLTEGNNNTSLGYNTGRGITTGNNNTIIGANVTGLASNLSNTIIIADGTGNKRIYIDSAGNMGIGDVPNEKLCIPGNMVVGNATVGTSGTRVLMLMNGTPPTSSPAEAVQLYAEDINDSAELKVRDEAGNITTLSPHNFSLFTPDSSYELPWSYYSKNEYIGKEINVDMYGAIKAIEELSGKKFIYTADISKREWDEDADQQVLKEALEEEIEITLSDAIETVEETAIVETGKKTEIGYELDLEAGEVKEVEKEVPVYENQPTGKIKKQLKPGVRFDETTGKFFRKKTEADVSIMSYIEKQPPQWIQDRIRDIKNKIEKSQLKPN